MYNFTKWPGIEYRLNLTSQYLQEFGSFNHSGIFLKDQIKMVGSPKH